MRIDFGFRRGIAAAVALAIIVLMVAAPALAQTGSAKSPTVLNAEVNSFWPDQSAGSITPFGARQTLLDIIASYLNNTTPAPGSFTTLTASGDAYFGSGRPWVDVRSGANGCAKAFGNGATDDTAAIQCQTTYLASTFSGGIVYFPPGNYHTLSTITVPQCVTYRGVGFSPSGIFGAAGSDITVLSFITGSGCAAGGGGVRDMTISGYQNAAATNNMIVIAANAFVHFSDSFFAGGNWAVQNAGTDGRWYNVSIFGFGTSGGGILSSGANFYSSLRIDQPSVATSAAFKQTTCSTSLCENHFTDTDFSGNYTNSILIDDTTNGSAVTIITGGIFSSPILVTTAKATIITAAELGSTTLTTNATGPLIISSSYAFAATTATGTGTRVCSANFNLTC